MSEFVTAQLLAEAAQKYVWAVAHRNRCKREFKTAIAACMEGPCCPDDGWSPLFNAKGGYHMPRHGGGIFGAATGWVHLGHEEEHAAGSCADSDPRVIAQAAAYADWERAKKEVIRARARMVRIAGKWSAK